MTSTESPPRSAVRLFAVYAAVSAVAVLLMGLALASSYRSEANRRGVAEGASEAQIVASTAVEPLLDGSKLEAPLPASTVAALTALSRDQDTIARLRVRDLDGRVIFSNDQSGLSSAVESDAIEAAEGHVEASLTRLNSDANDSGPLGDQVVEVYRPLVAGPDHATVGVLEIYLPYAAIRADIDAGMHGLYTNLVLGLLALYVLLAGLSLATTRGLRQHARTNAYLAEFDQLTGLPNRRVFSRRVGALTDGRGAAFGAVAVIDLDRFKDVNDSLGHPNGDELLLRLGLRLAEAVRPGDTVARLGGDEFGVVLARVVSESEATAALERLLRVMEQPLELAGLPITPEASIGFALFPDDGEDPEKLLQHADVALDLAKIGENLNVRYAPEQDDYDSDRLALVGELRGALGNEELVLHYQPKLDLTDGRVTAVEALIRWNHPRRRLLMPDAFLPVAEQTGLIEPLTQWVVATALRQVVDWSASGCDLAVAVNVSARNLSQAVFADTVLAALAVHDVAATSMTIEITETALLTDVPRATDNLLRLAAAGVPVSVDDFGRGQTSLGYLSQLPLHELKIDKSFVTDLLQVDAHAAIVRSVVELSHNLGYVVVAEGVEDAETLERLVDMGCDVVQGYGIARPMPADAVLGWLAARDSVSDGLASV
jgi:diguanylate cyclase (GGDEF)-like protein